MPEQPDGQLSSDGQPFTGAHPTNREFVEQLRAWGFTQRKEDGVHVVFRGPTGGTVRVIRSQLGRADTVAADKAARLAGVTAGEFWAGPAGCGEALVTTAAHRYAWTLEHGPIPPGLIVRHRCDEPLCTATQHLDLGTCADNRWDAIARPRRAARLDVRGSAGRSRAIREAILRVLALGATTPGAIGDAARAAMLAGDPNRDQLTLWPMARSA
jgi:HNH endonuclease